MAFKSTSDLGLGIEARTSVAEDYPDPPEYPVSSPWHDKDSLAHRRRRAMVRGDFENFVELYAKVTETDAIWNTETIIRRTTMFLTVCAEVATTKGLDSPEADFLWHRREAVHWWAMRIIPDFNKISVRWDRDTSRCINSINGKYGTAKPPPTKNLLGEAELSAMFEHPSTFETGLDNWEQHYCAWVMAHLCGVTPCSLTVAPGYEKGAVLMGGGVRLEDETLRWRDVEFTPCFLPYRIVVRIKLREQKESRDPYKLNQVIHAGRSIDIHPDKSKPYELDLATLIIGLAFDRGLFPYTTTEFLNDPHYRVLSVRPLPKRPEIDCLPVFVAVTEDGELDPNSAGMKEATLDAKLQEMCASIGLDGDYTMDSFRKIPILEIKRAEVKNSDSESGQEAT